MTVTGNGVDRDDPTSAAIAHTFLVPLDGSSVAERALPVARVLADRLGASVRTANMPPEPDDPTAEDRIGRFLGAYAIDGDTVLCVASRGHREHSPCGTNDLADRVLERLPGPAFVVGPHCSSGSFDLAGPILVCHDGSAAAAAIVERAGEWAAALRVPVHLVHVTHPLDGESARDPRANVADALDRLGPSARFEWVRSSFPAGAIRELAREMDASVIAMSTHGRNGLARVLLGSVTAWVVRESFCPVLVQRPDGLHGRASSQGGPGDD